MIENKRRHPLDARLLKKKIEGKEISILRVLEVREDKTILVIDCISAFMPKWITVNEIEDYEPCELGDLLEQTKIVLSIQNP